MFYVVSLYQILNDTYIFLGSAESNQVNQWCGDSSFGIRVRVYVEYNYCKY